MIMVLCSPEVESGYRRPRSTSVCRRRIDGQRSLVLKRESPFVIVYSELPLRDLQFGLRVQGCFIYSVDNEKYSII